MNDEILVKFVCLHVHGGPSGEGGGGSLIKTFPMEGQSRYFIFLLAMNLFDWSIITLQKKKKPSLW
jgi:hypothetical protein